MPYHEDQLPELAPPQQAPNFMANLISKMKHNTELGSRIAEIHNGSSSSPATPAVAKATSADGSSKATGLKPSSPCR